MLKVAVVVGQTLRQARFAVSLRKSGLSVIELDSLEQGLSASQWLEDRPIVLAHEETVRLEPEQWRELIEGTKVERRGVCFTRGRTQEWGARQLYLPWPSFQPWLRRCLKLAVLDVSQTHPFVKRMYEARWSGSLATTVNGRAARLWLERGQICAIEVEGLLQEQLASWLGGATLVRSVGSPEFGSPPRLPDPPTEHQARCAEIFRRWEAQSWGLTRSELAPC